jgi:hypothetical protein
VPNALRRNASERSDVRGLGWCTDASTVCDRPRARNENDQVSARSHTVILALTFGCLAETSSEASLLGAEYTPARHRTPRPDAHFRRDRGTGRDLIHLR